MKKLKVNLLKSIERCPDDPIVFFKTLYNHINEIDSETANSSILATSNLKQQPSICKVNMLLNKQELIFVSSYQSQESLNLAILPFAALFFSWPEICSQVQIQGKVNRLSDVKADLIFDNLKRSEQILVWVFDQKKIIANDEELNLRLRKVEEKFHNQEIPRPLSWGGFKIIPHRVEFWLQSDNGLNNIIYCQSPEDANNWHMERRLI